MQLAFPLFAIRARVGTRARCRALTTRGAALKAFVVITAAAAQGDSEKNKAKSALPLFLIPAEIPEAWNPDGRTFFDNLDFIQGPFFLQTRT
jgi:hypothetical protein